MIDQATNHQVRDNRIEFTVGVPHCLCRPSSSRKRAIHNFSFYLHSTPPTAFITDGALMLIVKALVSIFA